MSAAKAFLDTNIFVYSFDTSAPAKAQRARQLIRDGIEKRSAVVSFQVVQEFVNVALTRFAAPMTEEDAEQYVWTVFRPLIAVHSSPGLYVEALHLRRRYRFSWFDSLIVAAALEAGCTTLFSEDFQPGMRVDSLTVVNPFD